MTLINVKSHASCFVNEMADKRDQKGCLSEAVQIYPGQNKDGAFVLHIKELLRAQVAEDKLNAPLPRNEAPNKQILRQTISVKLSTSYEPSNLEILFSLRMF